MYSRSSFQIFSPIRGGGGGGGGNSFGGIGQGLLNNVASFYTTPPNIRYITSTTTNYSLNIVDEKTGIYVVDIDLLRDDRNFTVNIDKSRIRTGFIFDVFFKINVDWKHNPDMSKCFNIIFKNTIDSLINDSYINVNDSIVYINETNTDFGLANDENNVNKLQLEFSDFYGIDLEDTSIPPENFIIKNMFFMRIIVSKTNKDIVILKT